MEGIAAVRPYDITALVETLSLNRYADRAEIEHKPHIGFFDRYLSKLNAKTIIIENDYVDHDYLEDYSDYYVKCFDDYARRCQRIHFFSYDFDKEKFIESLKTNDKEFINSIKEKALYVNIVESLTTSNSSV